MLEPVIIRCTHLRRYDFAPWAGKWCRVYREYRQTIRRPHGAKAPVLFRLPSGGRPPHHRVCPMSPHRAARGSGRIATPERQRSRV